MKKIIEFDLQEIAEILKDFAWNKLTKEEREEIRKWNVEVFIKNNSLDKAQVSFK